jgi:hypothetical protein
VRFHVLTAASMKFRFVFWDVLPCKIIVDRRFRNTCCLHHQSVEGPYDGGSTYIWNVGRQLFYTAVHPRRQIWSLYLLFWLIRLLPIVTEECTEIWFSPSSSSFPGQWGFWEVFQSEKGFRRWKSLKNTTLDSSHYVLWLILILLFRSVFWVVLPCKMIVDRRFRGAYCLHTAVQPRRQLWTSYSPPWELEISQS